VKFSDPDIMNLFTNNYSKQTYVKSMCYKYLCFICIKNIVVADGIIWTGGGSKNAVGGGQEGSGRVEEVLLEIFP